jgi:hypothetical protein
METYLSILDWHQFRVRGRKGANRDITFYSGLESVESEGKVMVNGDIYLSILGWHQFRVRGR